MVIAYYFLDIEWADVTGRELVSLALVNEDGDSHFYAERANLPEAPTGLFVKASTRCSTAATRRCLMPS